MLLLVEFYRRGEGWKVRALGQGYADGLAGLARDFGVEVTDDAPPEPATAPEPLTPGADSDGFLNLVNSARAAAGSPAVRPDPRLRSAARAHAAAMAAAGTLSIETRDGGPPARRLGRVRVPHGR